MYDALAVAADPSGSRSRQLRIIDIFLFMRRTLHDRQNNGDVPSLYLSDSEWTDLVERSRRQRDEFARLASAARSLSEGEAIYDDFRRCAASWRAGAGSQAGAAALEARQDFARWLSDFSSAELKLEIAAAKARGLGAFVAAAENGKVDRLSIMNDKVGQMRPEGN
jgi:hypothetical protein